MAKYALTIGINRYEKPGSDLAGCVPDALDWQAALHERGFETTRLLDSEATGYNIRTHMAGTTRLTLGPHPTLADVERFLEAFDRGRRRQR